MKKTTFYKFLYIISAVTIFLCLYASAYYRIYLNSQIVEPGRTYLGMEVDAIDFTWNLTTVHQGFLGKLQSQLHYSSSLPESKSFLKFEYLFTGHLARIFHLSPLNAFYLVRTAVSILFFIFTAFVISRIFKSYKDRVLSLIMVFFGGGIVLKSISGLVIDAQVLYRFTTAAIHYQLGGLLSFLSLYFFGRFLESKTTAKRYFNLAVVIGIFGSLINAPAITYILIPLVLWFLAKSSFDLIKSKSLSELKINLPWLGTYLFLLSIPILYVHYVRSVVWAPYNFMRTEELNPFAPNLWPYLLLMGLPYLLAIIGFFKSIKANSLFVQIISFLVLVHPIGVFIIPRLLEFNTIRFFLVPYSFAYGILAIYGIEQLWDLLKKSNILKNSLKKYFYLLACFLLLVTSFSSYQNAYGSIQSHYTYDWLYYFGAPLTQHLKISDWIRDHVKDDEVVLTHLHVGTMVSAFSGKKVLITWWMNLAQIPTYSILLQQIQDFYGMKYSRAQALEFLNTNHVKYIVHGPMERIYNWPSQKLDYDFLEKVLQVEETVLFRVKD